MATTATTYGTFGNIPSFGFPKKRLRPERIMPKSQQVAKIQQYLSNRGAGIDVLDLVEDWVDPTVIYEVNKAEIISRVGFGSTRKPPSNKDLQEMHCVSLHNQCAANGLETCQIACDECDNPAACAKADKIKKEIKKHGRELTGFERMQAAHAKEAKRAPKKAKYSAGQTVKCREGYELQCGFSGLQKITQVKRYPDYVMYGIKGKLQGFVDEEWIVGVKVKKAKVLPTVKTAKPPKSKKKSVYVMFKGVRKHRLRCPICGRSAHENFCIVHSDVQALDLETSKKAQKLVTENLKYQKEHEKKIKKVKTTKSPKPRPAKGTPKKKKKVKTAKPSLQKKALPKKPKVAKVAVYVKALTKNQQALLRKYRFVDVSIQGKTYHITKQNVKDGKVEWYRKNGKVCLKNRR